MFVDPEDWTVYFQNMKMVSGNDRTIFKQFRFIDRKKRKIHTNIQTNLTFEADKWFSQWHWAFFNVTESRERGYEGNGIGLSIAKKAGRKLWGDVHPESEPGKGSTFFVQLPRKELVA
jgi:light-regulated signal transduction histidine kinase (bacteriophytochrome)